jgi:membrane-bound serine protease (ClpP class)
MMAIAILFVAGVALIFAEFFVPGGALGVLGGLMVMGSIALGWYRFPEYGVIILAGELAGVVVVVIVGLFVIFKTPVGRGLVLRARQEVSAGYADYAEDASLVGQTAKVQTPLRPAGSILLGSRRIDAVSSGSYIEAGKTVRIVEVEGHRVVCEEVAETPGEWQTA